MGNVFIAAAKPSRKSIFPKHINSEKQDPIAVNNKTRIRVLFVNMQVYF
jgi:hypothetical protein